MALITFAEILEQGALEDEKQNAVECEVGEILLKSWTGSDETSLLDTTVIYGQDFLKASSEKNFLFLDDGHWWRSSAVEQHYQ